MEVREGSRGKIESKFYRKRAWRQKAGEHKIEEIWLIIRKTIGDSKYRYQFCNADENEELEKMVKMSYCRYWVERSIQDAKQEVVLSDGS